MIRPLGKYLLIETIEDNQNITASGIELASQKKIHLIVKAKGPDAVIPVGTEILFNKVRSEITPIEDSDSLFLISEDRIVAVVNP